jgi:hypothetical protein
MSIRKIYWHEVLSTWLENAIYPFRALFPLINFYDGARKIARFHFHALVNVTLLSVYIGTSIRIVEIILEFRTFR